MILALLFSLAAVTTPCENAALDFPAMIDPGIRVTTAAALDFDHDGLLDLAVGGPDGVVVLRGDGRGGFVSRTTLSNAPAAELFTLGRDLYAFNAGTASDLSNGSSISGAGRMVHGRFNGERILFVTQDVRAVGDLDGDGNDDLVLLNGTTLTFLRWDGANFVNAGTAQISTPNPGTIVVADFDGDGRNDIGVRSSDIPLLDVYRGRGGFKFDPPLSTHYERGAFRVADVTGDGKPDLVADGPAFGSFQRGRGDGTFDAERPADRFIAQQGVLAVADFDKDGVPDIATLNPGGVSLARGSHYAPMYSVLDVADFNHDQIPDLLGSDGASTYVALGQPDGSYKVVAAADPRVPIPPLDRSMMAVADVNGDGNLDLLFAFAGGVTRYYGNGDGTFRAPKTFALPIDPLSLTLADVNRDGNLDAIFFNRTDNPAFTYVLGDADGNYASPHSLLQKIDVSDRGFVADFNGDGQPDLATAGIFGIAIALDDAGVFSPLPPFAAESQISGFVAIADFDRDRKADILYDDFHQLVLRSGFGDGTFGGPTYFGAQSGPYSIIDFNGDGLLDIVAGRNLILNRGSLLFSPPQPLPLVDEWTVVGKDLIGADGLVIRSVCPVQPQQRRRTARH